MNFVFAIAVASILSGGSLSQAKETVCMWYRDSITNTQLNGEYIATGEYNERDYYKMVSEDCSLPVLYLYYKDSPFDRWFIGETLGSNQQIFAQCAQSNVSLPQLCGKNWKFGSEQRTDEDAYVMDGGCPVVNAKHLRFQYTSGDTDVCTGYYTKEHDMVNVYKSPDTKRYLYFNEKSFKWVCSDVVNKSSCYRVFSQSSNGITNAWQDLSSPDSIQMSWSTGLTANISAKTIVTPGSSSSPVPTRAPVQSNVNPTAANSPTTITTSDNVCMWYRGGDTNKFLNGEYMYEGNYGGKPYFKMMNEQDCNSDEVFMFYHSSSDRWFIAGTLGSNQVWAQCTLDSIDDPRDCENNWVFGSESSADDNAMVMDAPCPTVGCTNGAVLSLNSGDDNYICDTTYDNLGTVGWDDSENIFWTENTQFSSGGRLFLYFNYKSFRWQCGKVVNMSSCSQGVYGYDSEFEWYSDLNDDSSPIDLEWVDYTGYTWSGTLQCLSSSSGTGTPVSTPTAVPLVNPNPTLAPVYVPPNTDAPASYVNPSFYPVASPTVMPFQAYTSEPTKNTRMSTTTTTSSTTTTTTTHSAMSQQPTRNPAITVIPGAPTGSPVSSVLLPTQYPTIQTPPERNTLIPTTVNDDSAEPTRQPIQENNNGPISQPTGYPSVLPGHPSQAPVLVGSTTSMEMESTELGEEGHDDDDDASRDGTVSLVSINVQLRLLCTCLIVLFAFV